jgi:hypothetical protein
VLCGLRRRHNLIGPPMTVRQRVRFDSINLGNQQSKGHPRTELNESAQCSASLDVRFADSMARYVLPCEPLCLSYPSCFPVVIEFSTMDTGERKFLANRIRNESFTPLPKRKELYETRNDCQLPTVRRMSDCRS